MSDVNKIKRTLPLLQPKKGNARVIEYYKELNSDNNFFKRGVLYSDIDDCVIKLIKEDFKLIDKQNTKNIVPVTLFNIHRWTEYYSTWDNVDKNKNIELPFISIIRVTDPQPGTARSNIKNIAGDRHYFHYKVPTNDGNREGFDIYKIPQPLPVDIKYEIKIFSFNIELLNDFNLMFQKKYKSGDLYIKPNGIWMSTKIENPSDNSSLGSINQRKYYSQTIVLTVKGWIIDPDDFIIEKGITRVVNDIYIDTLSNKSKVNVIQNENQSIFNLLLKDNLPQPVIEIQYKNYNDFIINNLIMNENITSYEIFSYGNKLFDSQKNSLPITISGGDKIVFRLIKDDVIDNLKLEFECVYV